ncbi:MAG: zinc ribbon domain-containing protein [Vibrionaceae bacterium]
MNQLCPTCQQNLTPNGAELACQHCHTTYVKACLCPQCHSALEKLQACGAANYFCPKCNELKSKSKVIHTVTLKPE